MLTMTANRPDSGKPRCSNVGTYKNPSFAVMFTMLCNNKTLQQIPWTASIHLVRWILANPNRVCNHVSAVWVYMYTRYLPTLSIVKLLYRSVYRYPMNKSAMISPEYSCVRFYLPWLSPITSIIIAFRSTLHSSAEITSLMCQSLANHSNQYIQPIMAIDTNVHCKLR